MWDDYRSNVLNKNYLQQAQEILRQMWFTNQVMSNGILAPGAGRGGYDFVNPSYFSPAFYKIFAKIDTLNNWQSVVDQSYNIIKKNPGYSQGLIPDWMRPDGNFYNGSLGYNPYLNGRAFFKDAIRTLWRIAIDAVWFNDPRAKAYLNNALNFINEKGGAKASNFYQIEGDKLGTLVPAEDKWKEFNDEKNTETWRYRQEHSHLTIGMWLTAAIAVGTDEDKKDFSQEMAKFYEYKADADFFGLIHDPENLEDTLHNEMYFDQFLAWFGVSLMSGTFSNILDDLDHPKENLEGILFNPFTGEDEKENEGESIKIFRANPKITISPIKNGFHFLAPTATHWQIYNLHGKEVSSHFGTEFSWNSKSHSALFILKTQSPDGTFVQKLKLQ